MSVESDEGVTDLGGGCGGNCEGCGVGAGAPDDVTDRPRKEPVPVGIRLARLTFVLGVLVGVGVAALVGIVWPVALPVLAAVTLAAVAAAGLVAVTGRRSAAGG